MAHKARRKTHSIRIIVGKTYITTKPLKMSKYDIESETTFKVLSTGRSWDNHTKLKIISGKIRNNMHSIHIPNATKDYNGGQHFLPLEKLKTELGISEDIVVSFDPFNNSNMLPCKEQHE